MHIHIHQLPVVIYWRVAYTWVSCVTCYSQEHIAHKQEEKMGIAGNCIFVITILQSTRRQDCIPV